jgi:glycosyltransferase involved in cell wall biosynthesis
MSEQPLIVVITATTGRKTLIDTIDSVQKQSYSNIRHVIVCDGSLHQECTREIIDSFKNTSLKHEIQLMTIPWQTGLNNWVCHRIYAAIPHLIVEDAYVAFLDEDNYIDSTHYEALYTAIKNNNADWAFSLRKIVSQTKEFITHDMCESLGFLSKTSLTLWYEITDGFKEQLKEDDPSHNLVDTNCYLIYKPVAQKIAHNWQYPARHEPEADRFVFYDLNKNYKGACSMKYTLNYRIDSRGDSAIADFYILGNEYMNTLYNNMIPWK